MSNSYGPSPFDTYGEPGPDSFFYWTYHYYPLFTVAVIDACLFASLTAALAALTLKHGGRFMWYAVLTGAVEVVGYALRASCAANPGLGAFIASTLLLLLGPILLALVNYHVVAVLLEATGKRASLLDGRLTMSAASIAKVFFISDLVCFLVQAAGGGLLSVPDAQTNNVGTAIVLVGLAIQLFFFTCFTWILWQVSTKPHFGVRRVEALRPVISGLVGTIVLLYVRNVFRFIEFASGTGSYVVKHEWVFNMFETLPIFLALVLYAVFHFGRLLEYRSDKPAWRAELAAVLAQEPAAGEPAGAERKPDEEEALGERDDASHPNVAAEV